LTAVADADELLLDFEADEPVENKFFDGANGKIIFIFQIKLICI
jgi:hypothetical protein